MSRCISSPLAIALPRCHWHFGISCETPTADLHGWTGSQSTVEKVHFYFAETQLRHRHHRELHVHFTTVMTTRIGATCWRWFGTIMCGWQCRKLISDSFFCVLTCDFTRKTEISKKTIFNVAKCTKITTQFDFNLQFWDRVKVQTLKQRTAKRWSQTKLNYSGRLTFRSPFRVQQIRHDILYLSI